SACAERLSLTLDRELLLGFAVWARQQLAARQLALERPFGLCLLGPPVGLGDFRCQRIGRAQALIRARLAHLNRHAAETVRKRFAAWQVRWRLLRMDGGDDRSPAGQLVVRDFISGADSEHAVFAQSRQVLCDRLIDFVVTLASHSRFPSNILAPSCRTSALNAGKPRKQKDAATKPTQRPCPRAPP